MNGSTWLRALRSTWWIVVLAVAAGAGAALLLNARQDLRYESVSSYVVSPRQGDVTDVVESVRTLDQARARALVSTYVEMLTSTAIQADAAAALGYGTFPAGYDVAAAVAPEAYVAELRVTGPSGADAAVLAGAIGTAASARFVGLYQIYAIAPLDTASVPTAPVNRGPIETALLGAILGLVAGLGIAFLAGMPRQQRRHRLLQDRLDAYGGRDATVTLFPAERRTTRAG